LPDLPARRSLWLRLLLGAVLIVSGSASATAVAAFREVDRVVTAFEEAGPLDLGDEVAEADAGKPQTIMLIGSDRRAKTSQDARSGASSGARSDTLILVRLDPEQDSTALLSLPRDLKVRIPGHGTDRLNAAYSEGGARLAVRTVKQLTGLSVNHVVNVDFAGFREAVDAIDCVYVDIDRRYYNDNTGPDKYATIDIRPGYQRLCGQDGLDYVRHRHSDNDIVRAARQQEFLRQAKQQVGVGRVFADRQRLLDVFSKYTESDIDSRKAVLRLGELVARAAGKPIHQVQFEGGSEVSAYGVAYVTADSRSVRKLADEFLGVGRKTQARSRRADRRPARRKKPRRPAARARVADGSAAGRRQALQVVGTRKWRHPVFYPRKRTPSGAYVGEPRVYGIRAPDGRVYSAYRMVLQRSPRSIGDFYGLQGTTWKAPPILERPSETRRLDGRRFELHYDGDRLRLVAWRTRDGAFWVSNSLKLTLSEAQMLAIARSARPLGER